MQDNFSPIVKKQQVRRFKSYDIEWYPRTMELRVIGVFDGVNYIGYRSVEAFLHGEMQPHNSGCWYFAHSGGLADFQFLLHKFVQDTRYTLKGVFSNSSCIVARVRRGKEAWEFIDSFWLLRSSLVKVGRSLGIAKGGEDYFCAGVNQAQLDSLCAGSAPSCGHPYRDVMGARRPTCIFYAPLDVLMDYNEQDCRILYEAVSRTQEMLLAMGGQLQPTLAGSAMNLFRRKYLSRTIEVGRGDNDFARGAYYSARNEVIRPRCGRAFTYDINGSFAHAMTAALPGSCTGLHRGTYRPRPNEMVIWDADLTVPEDVYLPSLPYRHDARVFFPTGRRRGRYTDVDLEEAVAQGARIHKVHGVATYEENFDFARFTADIFNLRRKAQQRQDEYESNFFKIFPLGVYGKMAEAQEKTALLVRPKDAGCLHTVPCIERDEAGEIVTESACVTMLLPGVYLRKEDSPTPHEHVAGAAWIGSVARRSLNRWVRRAILEEGEVYYVDTDALTVSHEMPTGAELGDLKLERRIDRDGHFLAGKLLRIDDTVKARGFSEMTVEKFARLAEGHAIGIERMLRIRELYKSGRTVPEHASVKATFRNKSRPKRAFLPGQNDTRPWSVEEIKNKWGESELSHEDPED